MGLSRNKVAVSEGAAGSPPFYGESAMRRDFHCVPKDRQTKKTRIEERLCCSIFRERFLKERVSATNAEGPPVPIPNTEVKLCSGEDTLRETVRENSSMPTSSVEGGTQTLPPKLKKDGETAKSHKNMGV